ncbi:unnamed protein product [Penicillium salamii]|uniref:Uncharacterized protein n=1 Tax=Penicillium salamii TaxID=1612424 RepID=A0A9W4JBQ8_9EURO|nr:unnamed protein product [Penicillium salamii]CAG8202698.1 unnamed protein product [Penicillium salamii]CAG8203455.1 unnamed protein product [Penicillium salamii]CAG8212913.1 unnamed protein product [Penicillium salamii]CAG8218077.1 unnamed protein product [Penicillium salamii]
MLALRDQENLVNTHQTAAAAKPLNQTSKFAPKTPGKRNDENNPLAFGGRTVKGNGNRLENGKPVKDAFITPMVKDRPPLGMKTNNLKAKNLQTPAPFGGTIKTNRRQSTAQKLKKAAPVTQQPQLKVHSDVVVDDVPDIEYMPPKPRDLPDLPDDVTYDTSFPQFQPRNRALGLESVYGKQQIGSDGLTAKQRKFKQDSAACDKMVDEMILKQLENVGFEGTGERESVKSRKPQALPLKNPSTVRQTRSVSTLRAREAAAALSGSQPTSSPRTTPTPTPRMASLASSASSLIMPKRHARVPSNPSSMRNTAAAATSRTTVGYSKGRSVSSDLREKSQAQKPSTSQALSPETYMQLYGAPPLDSEMWTRCKAAGCFDTEQDAQEPEEPLPTFEDEEADDFQLTL